MVDKNAAQDAEKAATDDGAADEYADLWNEFDEAEKSPGKAADAPSTGDRAEADDFQEDQSPTDADLTAKAESAVTAGSDEEQILASLPPEARKIVEDARAERQRIEHQISSDRGRISALQRQIAELKGETAPGTGPAIPRFKDRLKAVEDEYPEVAGPIIQALDEFSETIRPVVEASQQATANEQERLLASHHPDYVEVLTANGDAFQAWLAEQPRYVREGFARNEAAIVDAQEAADIVGRFKSHLGDTGRRSEPPTPGNPNPLAGRRALQLESARTVTSRRGPGAATGIPENASEEEIWRAMDQEDERKRQRR